MASDGAYIEDIITATLAQLVSGTNLSTTNVYLTRQELPTPKIRKSVQQIGLFISQFVPDVGQQIGGSKTTFVLDAIFVVTAWSTYMVDQVGQGEKFLSDPAKGSLPLMRKILNALEQFAPTNQDGSQMLEEPMRLSPGGFQLLPSEETSMQAWRSEWQVNFIQKLP